MPHFLNDLDALPFEFRYVVRYEGMSLYESRAATKKRQRDLEGYAIDVRALIASWLHLAHYTTDVVGMKEAMEAQAARLDAEDPGVSSGRITPAFVVWGRTRDEVEAK